MALMGMKNAGIVDPDKINGNKTKVVLLAYKALLNGIF
jgi:hypothetical protein